MLLRRKLIAIFPCLVLTLFNTAAPYTIKVHGVSAIVAEQVADAKDGNGNGGGGGSGGGGSGGGSGNGGSSGNSGGNGNSGSNGNSGGKGSNNGQSSGTGNTAKSQTDVNDAANSGRGALTVRHRDGISESVQRGRYVMKDAKGRTIVNRDATTADEQRLRSFLR
ncbi:MULTISPECIES: hypothetical protein [Agrobacterium tumefaciens complex]|uniref:hypothetical protein n=1 Tax=Agrobacterium tumefaciens complex TaxID=1183400 RepID=UPI0010F40D09|nr:MULTISPECIES: hypothetical protein [Agrobacterium tumefaciens complex]MBB4409493.1 hypothetical protein [Agrobacterium radiobacter]MBB4454791.1 hypothetical protein [Agrobacterium radiobacter]MBP2536338.1 hypothetical protein [Agrobacterium tumefaciens]MDP9857680.1 hypothetical protein [Agrobacterium tumefaciens]TCV48623.1 hypothetical protein EDB97_11380 [Agrobacterium tumefaciens]